MPFLVLLPLIEGTDLMADGQSPISLLANLGPTALKTVGGLALLLLGGRFLLRRLFELVAAARSDETFVALSLLTVTGAALITQVLPGSLLGVVLTPACTCQHLCQRPAASELGLGASNMIEYKDRVSACSPDTVSLYLAA